MKKIFKKLHLWLSVPFGIVMMLSCFSGAMLVFEAEISGLVQKKLFRVEPPSENARPLPLGELAASVAATLPEGVEVTGFTVPSDSREAYRASISQPARASVAVDPYTGEVKGRVGRLPFFRTMFSLHRWLMGSRPADGGIFWGKLLVGISTLLFVGVLLTGLIIWWPRTMKLLKARLKITLRAGWLRFCHGLHVAGGAYVLLLLLVMALTGLTWSFDWYRTGFYKLFGVETSQQANHGTATQGGHSRQRQDGQTGATQGGHSQQGQDGQTGATQVVYSRQGQDGWQEALEALQASNPGYKQISVSQGTATVSFPRLGNIRAADRYTFDQRSGELTGSTLYKDSGPSGKIRGWIYSVHVGSFGGWFTRILWFLAALTGAFLPITGYYLWIRRLRAKRKSSSAMRRVHAANAS